MLNNQRVHFLTLTRKPHIGHIKNGKSIFPTLSVIGLGRVQWEYSQKNCQSPSEKPSTIRIVGWTKVPPNNLEELPPLAVFVGFFEAEIYSKFKEPNSSRDCHWPRNDPTDSSTLSGHPFGTLENPTSLSRPAEFFQKWCPWSWLLIPKNIHFDTQKMLGFTW